jgi:exopolysaccharide production protein ExoQ
MLQLLTGSGTIRSAGVPTVTYLSCVTSAPFKCPGISTRNAGANAGTLRGKMNGVVGTFETETATVRPLMVLPALIGFFFSFRLFIVLLAVRVFQADPQTGVGVSLGLNFLLLGIVAFHSLGSAPRTVESILRLPACLWVLLFLGFSGISLFWCTAVSLPAAVAFWCAMLADATMVVFLLRTGPVIEMSSALMKGYVCGACCIALIAWILPAQSDLRLGDEELLGANQIGYACAFAIFLAQFLILVRRDQGPWKSSIWLLAVTLLRSLSKTTIIAFVAGQAILLVRDKSITRKAKTRILLATAIVIAISSSLLASYYDVYTNAGNQSETLTGRIGIWAYIFGEALDRPWIGHGFHSVWKVIPPFGPDQFEARHAHNELLQQFYAYGAVGVLMLIGIYRSFYRQARRLPASSLKTLLFGLLVFVIVRGLADTEAFDLSFPLWAIIMFSAIVAQSCGLPQSAAITDLPSASTSLSQ